MTSTITRGWLLALGLALVGASTATAAMNVSAGAGTRKVGPQSTGIYTLGSFSRGTSRFTTQGLFHRGQLLEVHTKRSNQWLPKQSGSSKKTLAASKFDELAGIAGTNVDVEKLSLGKREQFYLAAGLTANSGSGESSTPIEVDPGPGKFECPPNYEFNRATKKCRLVSWEVPPTHRTRAPWWKRFSLIPTAEAKVEKLVYFRFDMSKLFGNILFEYNPQGGSMGFSGFGVTALWAVSDD